MKITAKNKKAYFDYSILDTFDAGVVFSGPEVKSVKRGDVNLKGAFVVPTGNEMFLINAHIGAYKPASGFQKNYDPTRSRKLLLTRREINKLIGTSKERGISLIPLKFYVKNGLVKLEIGVGKGKKKYQKREALKKKDIERDLRRDFLH